MTKTQIIATLTAAGVNPAFIEAADTEGKLLFVHDADLPQSYNGAVAKSIAALSPIPADKGLLFEVAA